MRRFLQGLGLGLLVAAIVMGIGTRGAVSSSSNENIIERARELGMVFPRDVDEGEAEKLAESSSEPVESDNTASGSGAVGAGAGGDDNGTKVSEAPRESASPETSEEASESPSPSPEKTKKPKKSSEPKKTATPNPSESSDPNRTPSTHANLPQGTRVEFKVREGLLSSSVARELYEQGIISDMWAFDHYIEEHGLGQRIIVGTYELEVGDSYANIARIITHGA